jgi:uncharacterized phage protein gp47/JayE
MSPTKAIDLTAREFDTNLQALIDTLKKESPESWNSFYEGDLGKIILDLISYDFSILSYTADMAAGESFIDTHRTIEAQQHFCNQNGYKARGATAAVIELYCQTSSPPATGSYQLIKKNSKIRSTNGLVWETSKDYYIEPGKLNPVTEVLRYGDLRGSVISPSGVVTKTDAVITIKAGSSQAILTDVNGVRLSSEVGFGVVSEGSILKLTKTYNPTTGIFGPAPSALRNEYAIISIGKLDSDAFDKSVLFLDRVWDQETNFIGQWVIENRNIEVIQGESFQESHNVPSALEDRVNWSVKTSFYPVIFTNNEGTIPAGFFGNALDGEGYTNTGVEVYVNGIQWEETSNLIFEVPTSRAYQVSIDELGRVLIKFGDGRFGKVLPSDAIVSIKYRVGGGKDGNVPQGYFNTSIQADSSTGDSVAVYVSNPYTVGRGGQDKESMASVRANLKNFIRTNDRAVSVEDYDYLASNFVDKNGGRIKHAKSVLNTNMVPREQNIVWVHTWTEGVNGQLTKPNALLKRRLHEYLDKRKMLCDEVVILDGQTRNIPVEFRYKYSSEADESLTQEAVRASINAVFKSLLPGDQLSISRLYEAMESIPQVEWVNFYSPYENISPQSEYTLLINSVQPAARVDLTSEVSKADTVIMVSDPAQFVVGGLLSLFELGRSSSCVTIESISGNMISIRPETPLIDSYTTAATVLNSDWHATGWQYERIVNVYVTYGTLNGGSLAHIGHQIKKKITDYFARVINVEESLSRVTLQALVSSISGITSYSVNLGSVDSQVEVISMIPREKATLGKVIINGTDF